MFWCWYGSWKYLLHYTDLKNQLTSQHTGFGTVLVQSNRAPARTDNRQPGRAGSASRSSAELPETKTVLKRLENRELKVLQIQMPTFRI